MFSDPIKNLAELDVQDGMKVADIGAGSGFYSIEVAKKVGARGLVYAVDVQQDLLERLKKSAALVGLHNIEIIWGNAEKIGGTKLRENIADRVIVSNVLFQIEPKDRDNFVLELKRIVKPGGKLLVVDWQSGSPLTPPTAVPVMTAEALFQKAGWTLEKNFDAGDHHYGIIFKKP
jgi:ubiquinone/menaquinone biosynthesis C-methylase UbiE